MNAAKRRGLVRRAQRVGCIGRLFHVAHHLAPRVRVVGRTLQRRQVLHHVAVDELVEREASHATSLATTSSISRGRAAAAPSDRHCRQELRFRDLERAEEEREVALPHALEPALVEAHGVDLGVVKGRGLLHALPHALIKEVHGEDDHMIEKLAIQILHESRSIHDQKQKHHLCRVYTIQCLDGERKKADSVAADEDELRRLPSNRKRVCL